jgi:hypothetical protein
MNSQNIQEVETYYIQERPYPTKNNTNCFWYTSSIKPEYPGKLTTAQECIDKLKVKITKMIKGIRHEKNMCEYKIVKVRDIRIVEDVEIVHEHNATVH